MGACEWTQEEACHRLVKIVFPPFWKLCASNFLFFYGSLWLCLYVFHSSSKSSINKRGFCVCVCLSVCYRRPLFWTELHQSWCGGGGGWHPGKVMSRLLFAARPPGGMGQTLEPGKPESAYITCIEYLRLSSWISRQPLDRFQPNLVCE